MAAQRPVKVLGLLTASMGHVPWAEQLAAELRAGRAVDYRPVWNRDHGPGTRAMLRAATLRLPGSTGSGWDFWFARAELGYSLAARRKLRRALAEGAADVVHVHTQSLALTLRADMAPRPFVVSLDSTSPQVMQAEGASLTHLPLVRLERRALAEAAHVVCWSEHARRSVCEELGVPADRTSVIPPGVDARLFTLDRDPDVPPRLLFVGGDFERKGGHDVLAATADLPAHVGVDLVTSWSGPVPDNVVLHHDVRPFDDRWLRLYRDASAFVLPTRYEAYGLALAEAQAAGLPVISTRVQAVPEIVEHDGTGLLVPSGDRQALAAAVRRVVDDRDFRLRAGRAARERAQLRWAPDRTASAMADVFSRAAGRAI